ncbi:jg22385, partial [Pararge aegeria aegeria]
RQWNPDAAEKMLRDSMKWREKWGVDTTLASWQAPAVLEQHFPSGTTGFDKEGSPSKCALI